MGVENRRGGPMPGDGRLGAVLRELRMARGLSLAAVARQAGCDQSLISFIELGQRQLHPWLAAELDRIYATGSVVACLARGSGGTPQESSASGVSMTDVFVVRLPQGGAVMLLSRREVLTALGLGIVSGGLQGEFERALDRIECNDEVLQFFEDAFRGFQEAARMLPPAQLIDGLIGNVAVLDGLRRRAAETDQHRYSTQQARCAELLSWLSEEAGDYSGAMWWNDRASQWAQAAGWPGMTVYGFVRRAMMVGRTSSEGLRIVDQARPVLGMSQASLRMKGWAANEMALGYALAGDRDKSHRALDTAVDWLAQSMGDDDAALQRSIAVDDLFTVYQATCDIYLGHGARSIPVLEPRLDSLVASSFRTATITRAKLARAYVNAGQPEEACRVAWETLDAIEQVGSLSARNELRRALPVLNQWRGRSDVQDVVHRLRTSPSSIM
ncbi:MAG: helix-turn-helix domain-containing protein [Pseudonocardiaceae bacterium]